MWNKVKVRIPLWKDHSIRSNDFKGNIQDSSDVLEFPGSRSFQRIRILYLFFFVLSLLHICVHVCTCVCAWEKREVWQREPHGAQGLLATNGALSSSHSWESFLRFAFNCESGSSWASKYISKQAKQVKEERKEGRKDGWMEGRSKTALLL